jgi:hypothetical protein
VFLSEGIQKFLFPDSLGVGREDRNSLAARNGSVCGHGGNRVQVASAGVLFTRFAAIALLVVISVALYSTKIVTFAPLASGALSLRPGPI